LPFKKEKKFILEAPLDLRVAQIHLDYGKERPNQEETSIPVGALKGAFVKEERVNQFQEPSDEW